MPAQSASHSVFVPLLLGRLGFQSWQSFSEPQALQTAYASQQQPVDNSAKLRAYLDTLAADTQRLADAGNPDARTLVEELEKRGVTINPASTPATPASGTAPAVSR